MKRHLSLILCILIAAVCINEGVWAAFGGEGAFGSIVNYLKRITTDVIPDQDDTRSLGSADKKWKGGYFAGDISAGSISGKTQAIPISFEMAWEGADTYHQHYNIKIGTGTSPEGGSYILDKESKDNQTGWVYYSPDNLVQIPAGGVDYTHNGLLAQYTVAVGTLTKQTIYNAWKRVYNVDDTIYGDWNFIGSISR
ncbi:MAG: hypothetical protein KAX15_02755 [Candidatus Omnitrophica bacterium]|nr:hypothetical protein [Candidatus Omnitrophota bacterium]